ncbi:GtrA family protein [Halieaceae bacterium IMCC8485]|uniref:GtrA family protein n=1 Tax=Candidatus Seongchinamella marina TaxID=2518990 RepID=A0ABT3SVN4_9GAMM|nr:GtrA family protein [Candidatus Seongchinamella marina]
MNLRCSIDRSWPAILRRYVSATRRKLVETGFRFALVGVITGLVHYGLVYLGVSWLGWDSLVASSVGFVVAVSCNYLMHYGWTFAVDAHEVPPPHGATLGRYLTMVACGFVINGLVMYLSIQVLDYHYLVAQAFASVAVVLWNYFVANFWVFKR